MSKEKQTCYNTYNQIKHAMVSSYVFVFVASGMTCFDTRLGCLEADDDSLPQKMINASSDIFRLSRKLKFSVPLYKYFTTPTWKKLVQAEDFFFGYKSCRYVLCVLSHKHLIMHFIKDLYQHCFISKYNLCKAEMSVCTSAS